MSNPILLAQCITVGGQNICGPLDPSVDSLGKIITKLLSFIMPIAGIVLLFVLISGGYDYMMSQGSPDKLKSAQGKITTGIIGFILLIISFVVVKLIAAIFGLGGGIF
jgi:TRAP-type C4-dicarboxylate transport system permease small subunit